MAITDGLTPLMQQERRNNDPVGGANKQLLALTALDARTLTISGTINAATEGVTSGGLGGQIFLGVITRGLLDFAAADHNSSLWFAPINQSEGIIGLFITDYFGDGDLYLAANATTGSSDTVLVNLSAMGLTRGISLIKPITFSLAFASARMIVTVNGKEAGSAGVPQDLRTAFVMASCLTDGGATSLQYSNVVITTPNTQGAPAVMLGAAGNNQSGAAGGALTAPVSVSVLDALRNPLSGVTVKFSGTNATANPASAVTDSKGQAATNVTLGSTVGTAGMAASIAGGPTFSFQFTVTAGSLLPTITGVVNGASFVPGIVSGSWATVQGSHLAARTRSWTASDFVGGALPIKLDNTSVMVNGKPAFIYFISDTQLNILIPDDAAVGLVSVDVTSDTGTSAPFNATKVALAPALFVFTARYPAALHADATYVGPPNLLAGAVTAPVKPGETILLFGTGFGATNPSIATGSIFGNAAPLAQKVFVTIGPVTAQVPFAGMVTPGLYQFNVEVPALPDGDAPVSMTIGGASIGSGLFLAVKN
jgi:uncharacterized protein (TIGR03437 family)